MSISPPTDIILDVTRAADPARYQEATARLSRISATVPPDGFNDALKAVAPPRSEAAASVDASEALNRMRQAPAAAAKAAKDASGKAGKAYEGFEAVALTNFVEAMMPKQASAVFGAGTAGDVWKSMMAQQIAAELAHAGGIGIADHLKAAHPADEAGKSKNGITEIGETADKTLAESAIVAANQRGFLSTIMPDHAVGEGDKG
jgi:flagellar protein FlgJ